MKEIDIRVHEKYVLTIDEAALYFGIGRNRLYTMIHEQPNADWVLWIGSHAHIKRHIFERMIDGLSAL